MKSISKIILGIIISFVVTINVSAVTINKDANNKVTNQGTLKVTNVDNNDTFKAYKVLDTYYDANTNQISYQFTTDFQSYLTSINSTLTVAQYQALTGGDITSGEVRQANELDALVSGYASYIKTNNVSGSTMNVANKEATLTTASGSYLVLPTQTKRVYSVMVGNIEFSVQNNDWQLNNATIEAKVSDPSISKCIYKKGTNECVTSASYNIGDKAKYRVTIKLPTYPANATNRTVNIEDTLPTGLEHTSVADIEIKNGDKKIKRRSDDPLPVGTLKEMNTWFDTTKAEKADFKSITTLDYIDIPTGAISWDASAEQNETIMVWYVDNGCRSTNTCDLYIGQEGGVKANPNSSFAFTVFNNVTTMDLSKLDTSNVTSMDAMISGNNLTTIDLTSFDTSKVTSMESMFGYCQSLITLDLSSFNTSNVEIMDSMFDNCESLTTIYVSDRWDTSNVISSTNMFDNCISLPNFSFSVLNKTNAHYGSGGYLTYKAAPASGTNNKIRDYKVELLNNRYNEYKVERLANGTDTFTEGTVTINGQKMSISLDASKLTTNTITIEYEVLVKDNAVLGPTGNENTVKLEYSNDPYGSGTTTVTDSATLYTYGIKIYKYNGSTALSGAEFEICSDNTCSTVIDSITTDTTGYATYSGLASGTYYIREIKAPSGYRLDNQIRSIVIDTSKEYTETRIENERQGLLPNTGGMGTYLYIGAGALLVVGVLFIVVRHFKKEN